jgi:hypothetical protein
MNSTLEHHDEENEIHYAKNRDKNNVWIFSNDQIKDGNTAVRQFVERAYNDQLQIAFQITQEYQQIGYAYDEKERTYQGKISAVIRQLVSYPQQIKGKFIKEREDYAEDDIIHSSDQEYGLIVLLSSMAH